MSEMSIQKISTEIREIAYFKVVTVYGDMSNSCIVYLRRVINSVLSGHHDDIVFDLSLVESISSSGLRILHNFAAYLQQHHGRLFLLAPASRIVPALRASGLLDAVHVFVNEEDIEDYIIKDEKVFL